MTTLIGLVATVLLLPETNGKSIEELSREVPPAEVERPAA